MEDEKDKIIFSKYDYKKCSGRLCGNSKETVKSDAERFGFTDCRGAYGLPCGYD